MTDSSALPGTVDATADVELNAAMEQARRVLVEGQLADVAERAWFHLTTPPATPTLVVVGEVKRGKSSLVNALLGRPGASPVDVDITTSAFIRFVPVGDAGTEGDTALLYAGGRRETIDFADLPDWVTVTGRHVIDPKIDELPIGAEVALDSEFLPNLVIVDTPGVGGLNPNHLRLARTASAGASILLMTCDATAPITAPELEFLDSVSAEVGAVIIAVTKIDKNYSHWRSILDEDRRLLREHAPRFAESPIFGVSTLDALSALMMEPGDRRGSALHASGLMEIVGVLHEICASAGRLATANGLRIARTGLQRLTSQLEMQRSAVTDAAGITAELSQEEQRLQALRKEQEGPWRDDLTRELSTLQRTATTTLDHQLDDLKARWKTKLDKTHIEFLRRSPQLFVADMTADLEALVALVSDEYAAGIARMLDELKISTQISLERFSTRVRGDDPHKRGHGLIDPQMSSYFTGGIVQQLIPTGGSGSVARDLIQYIGVGGAALAIGHNPLLLGIGVGVWAAVNLGYRATRASRQELQQWINNTASQVNKDVGREIQARAELVRPIITNEYKRQLTDSMAELQSLITTAQEAAKASSAQRDQTLAELDTKQQALQATTEAIDTQLARFTLVKA